MTSAIADVLNNPQIKGSNNYEDKSRKEASSLAYLLQGFNKGLISLPDMALNALSLGGKGIGQNPIENIFKKIGVLNELPEAKSNINKLAESFGGATGGMVIPGAGAVRGLSQGAGALNKGLAQTLLGTQSPLKNAGQLANKNFAATVGGSAAQASAQPGIEYLTDNPLLRTALGMGAGIAGGGASTYLGKNPTPALPNATAAQRAFQEGKINDPRTKSLERKQLELAQSDPKTAALLQQISEGQEGRIYQQIPKGGQIDPNDISNEIKRVIDDFKRGRNSQFMQTEEQLFSQPNALVNIDNVLQKSENILNRFDDKSPLKAKLTGFIERLKESNGDPYKINSLKQEISDATDMGSPLYLGKKQSKLIGDVARDIDQAISDSIPGYKELLNKPYAEKTKMLEKWIEGPVGKVFEKGESSKPSDIFKTIFENTDKRLSGELKEIIPSELYGQAADEYLSDLTRMARETPSKPRNTINQVNKIKDHLIKNNSQLETTLPEEQYGLVKNLISDIEQTGFGRPTGDYASKAESSILRNMKGVLETTGQLGKKAFLDRFDRNEMISGQTPIQQIGEFGTNIGRNVTVRPGIAAQGIQSAAPAPIQSMEPVETTESQEYQRISFDDFERGNFPDKKQENKGDPAQGYQRISFEDFVRGPKK